MSEKLIMRKAMVIPRKNTSGKKLQVNDDQHQKITELSEYTGRNIYQITWELLDFALRHVERQEKGERTL